MQKTTSSVIGTGRFLCSLYSAELETPQKRSTEETRAAPPGKPTMSGSQPASKFIKRLTFFMLQFSPKQWRNVAICGFSNETLLK